MLQKKKIAEVIHGLLYLEHLYSNIPSKRPIDFYVSTYGSADDMFSLYDIMRQVGKRTKSVPSVLVKLCQQAFLFWPLAQRVSKDCQELPSHDSLGHWW